MSEPTPRAWPGDAPIADPDAPPPPPPEAPASTRGQAWLLWALGIAALAWAIVQVAFFWRANPALWSSAAHPELALGVFSGLWAGPWRVSLAHAPPWALALSIAIAGLNVALGQLVLRALDLSLRPGAAWSMALLLGVSVSGIAFELLTLAGQLNTPAVWTLWVVLLLAASFIAGMNFHQPYRRWWSKPDPKSPEWNERFDLPMPLARGSLMSVVPSDGDALPESRIDRALITTGWVLIGLITAATFWHAVLFPEVYWDSLILYLGYARWTFLEGAFPFKAVAQVGIGLGANYPHLYPNYGATAAAMAGAWTEVPQRFVAPLAGLAATVLVYEAIRLTWRRRVVAVAVALLFRAVPLGVAYSTYASDYSFSLLFGAGFLYAAALLGRSRLPGAFVMLTFLPAAAMHLNFLMGILWVPWAVAVTMALGWRREPEIATTDEPRGAGVPTCLELLRGRFFWIVLLACFALASPWYIRNAVLTGNPVYAFFPQIFTRSINVNPEVLDSAKLEWFRNGDGIARVAEQFVDIEVPRPMRDQGAEDFARESTLGHKLRASWLYWQGFETFRVIPTAEGGEELRRGDLADRLQYLLMLGAPHPLPRGSFASVAGGGAEVRVLSWFHVYKMAPLVMGFALLGVWITLVVMGLAGGAARCGAAPFHARAAATLVASSIVLALGLLAFNYLLADFYLYQILPVIVPMAVLSVGPLALWLAGGSPLGNALKAVAAATLLAMALVPGMAMALMNFKASSGGELGGVVYSPLRLDVMRHPAMAADDFYRLRFGADVDMWREVNARAYQQPLLTHENRHVVFDPSIELVQLDDWDVQQQMWGKPVEERLAFLERRGITQYLRVPNERNHPINARAGMQELIDLGHFREVVRHGDNILYERASPSVSGLGTPGARWSDVGSNPTAS